MIADRKKKNQYIGLFLLHISGILCIISEFIPWTNEFSIFQLFHVQEITNHLIYLIPLIGGIVIVISALNITLFGKKSYKIWYIFLVVILNLLFYFLLDVFSNQGAYLWRYSGIYLVIFALLFLLFGMLFQFTSETSHS